MFTSADSSPDKQRPVLILTRDSAIGHLPTLTVVPIILTIRGAPSDVILDVDDGLKARRAVNLRNVVTVSQQRLDRRVDSLTDERMREAIQTFTMTSRRRSRERKNFTDSNLPKSFSRLRLL